MKWREQELGIASPENWLEIADGEVRAARALREDLLVVLFPQGGAPPSELLQSRVKHKIQSLVYGIEAELVEPGEHGRCWAVLSRSGLLREEALIDFALARVAEDDLRRNLSAAKGTSLLSQLPVQLFDHENARIAQLAKTLLNAELLTANDQNLFYRLEPDLFHQMCWRIVAALQEIDGGDNDAHIAKAQALISGHDTDRNPSAAAQKLVFFLGPEYRNTLLDPSTASLHLFVAILAQEFALRSDAILQLLAAPKIAPLMVLLTAAAVPQAQLQIAAMALRQKAGEDDSHPFPDNWCNLDPVEARAQVAAWSKEAVG